MSQSRLATCQTEEPSGAFAEFNVFEHTIRRDLGLLSSAVQTSAHDNDRYRQQIEHISEMRTLSSVAQ